jgi:lipopolysaccharide/colanic/teichoic acid biosynthesis glycosyltransferase
MLDILSNPKQACPAEIRTSPLIRGLDLVVSGIGLLLLVPVFLVIASVIRLTSPGPVFYKANRVGKDGRLFRLYKLRSMHVGADCSGPGITVRDDPRVTPVGRFLRQTKLDELPQLINVFRGEMSLVGPRPEDPRHLVFYTPAQLQALAVRPGMTSPASLHYQHEETLLTRDDWEAVYRDQILPHKLSLDLAYLRRRTLWTDLSLILQTISVIIFRRKASELDSGNA